MCEDGALDLDVVGDTLLHEEGAGHRFCERRHGGQGGDPGFSVTFIRKTMGGQEARRGGRAADGARGNLGPGVEQAHLVAEGREQPGPAGTGAAGSDDTDDQPFVHGIRRGRQSAVSRLTASQYFSRVFSTTSAGSAGAGGSLFHLMASR